MHRLASLKPYMWPCLSGNDVLSFVLDFEKQSVLQKCSDV